MEFRTTPHLTALWGHETKQWMRGDNFKLLKMLHPSSNFSQPSPSAAASQRSVSAREPCTGTLGRLKLDYFRGKQHHQGGPLVAGLHRTNFCFLFLGKILSSESDHPCELRRGVCLPIHLAHTPLCSHTSSPTHFTQKRHLIGHFSTRHPRQDVFLSEL